MSNKAPQTSKLVALAMAAIDDAAKDAHKAAAAAAAAQLALDTAKQQFYDADQGLQELARYLDQHAPRTDGKTWYTHAKEANRPATKGKAK